MNTTYLSCVLFFGTCCWTPTDNIGGGGGGGGGGGRSDWLQSYVCSVIDAWKLWSIIEHYLFIMCSFFWGTCCWTLTDNMGGGGGWWLVTSYVCSVIDAWKLWSIMNTTYLSCVLFFWALAVGPLTDNMDGGGGGGWGVVIGYILCFLFSFSIPCKFLFASLCNISDFATFWTLLTLFMLSNFFAHMLLVSHW